MIEVSSPLQIAALAAAVGWPLIAGLGVVLWSKARAAERARKLAAAEGEMRGLYRKMEAEPVPERLLLVVEALEEAEAMQGKTRTKTKAGRKTAASAA